MRITESQPVTWPDEQSWRRWWRAQVAGAESELVERDGAVLADDQVLAHLIAGEHLRPGARYRAHTPDLTVGEITGEITTHGSAPANSGGTTQPGGDPGGADRAFGVTYQEHAEPSRGAAVQIDALDDLGVGHLVSTLRYLAADGWFAPHQTEIGVLNVTLDWAHITVSVSRTVDGPSTFGGGGESGTLRVDLEITGRGAWRPVLAPLLRVGRGQLQRSLSSAVTEVAAGVNAQVSGARPGGAADRAEVDEEAEGELPSDTELHPEDDIRTDDELDLFRLDDDAVDLSWLASPVAILRKGIRAGRS